MVHDMNNLMTMMPMTVAIKPKVMSIPYFNLWSRFQVAETSKTLLIMRKPMAIKEMCRYPRNTIKIIASISNIFWTTLLSFCLKLDGSKIICSSISQEPESSI